MQESHQTIKSPPLVGPPQKGTTRPSVPRPVADEDNPGPEWRWTKPKRSGSELCAIIEEETQKLCARCPSRSYGLKGPVCSHNSFGGEKWVAGELEAAGPAQFPSPSFQLIFGGSLGLLETGSQLPWAFSSWQRPVCPHFGSLSVALAGTEDSRSGAPGS